jgi:hypothetical protein
MAAFLLPLPAAAPAREPPPDPRFRTGTAIPSPPARSLSATWTAPRPRGDHIVKLQSGGAKAQKVALTRVNPHAERGCHR